MSLDLSAVGTGELQALRDRLAAGRLADPLTRRDAGLLSQLAGLSCAEVSRLLDALLAERRCQPPPPDLVWTGPAPVHAATLDTSVTLKQLFGRAQSRVIVAGYSFDHGKTIFAPLHEAMVERGVEAEFFLHVPTNDHERRLGREAGQTAVERRLVEFLHTNWPGPPWPHLHYDPRPMETGLYASLHAKCVVVDEREALVTSANFTYRGHERNVEVGALIRDPRYARALAAQWHNARAHGMFVSYRPG